MNFIDIIKDNLSNIGKSFKREPKKEKEVENIKPGLNTKLSNLRKVVTRTAIIFTITVICCGYLKLFLDEKLYEVTNSANSLVIQLANAQSDLTNLEKRIKDFVSAKKLWEKINLDKKERNGVNFDLARNVLDGLNKSKYFSSDIKSNLSAPTIKLSDDKSKIGIETSNVTLGFKAMSDNLGIATVKKLQENLNGFVIFKSLKMARISEVTPSALDSIRKGLFPELIELTVEFSWQNLKDLSQ